MRFFLRALACGILLMGIAQSAQAAPVSVLQVELSRHGGDLQAAWAAVEKQFASSDAKTVESKPAPKPQPKRIVEPAVVQLPATTAHSMTSTSVTSPGGSSSSVPPAKLADTPDLLLVTPAEAIETSNWLFLPPRFLDGVFRPPRHVDSF